MVNVTEEFDKLKALPRLENWHIGQAWDGKGSELVYGLIYNDSRFPDGMDVRTSAVVSVEGDILTTRNTVYLLGEAYEAL